ncbi:MAG TPA: hypothetical protein PL141_04625, partial [Thermoflexales bacterium]|nr:hypothetical protein [Thermoflexales bacterium]
APTREVFLQLVYERRKHPMASPKAFAQRMARHILMGLSLSVFALGIGMIGYRVIENLSWVDAFFNASMIVTGMGPTAQVQSDAGKIFSGLYAIFAFIVYVSNLGIILAPVAHRILHRFHLDENE